MRKATRQTHRALHASSRNLPCSCGSGKKYKTCCLRQFPYPSASAISSQSVAELVEEARGLLGLGRLEEASGLLGTALGLRPDDADVLHLLGLTAHEQGDLSSALVLLESSVLRAPENAVYTNNLGLMLDKAGQPETAISMYRRSLRLDPGMADAHFNLGTALTRKGLYAEAALPLAEASRLRPHFAEAINTLGVVLRHLGSHHRAMVCYRRAICMKPDLAEAHSNLGSSLAVLDRYPEALESLKCALALEPSLADAYVNLGSVLRSIGRYDEAIAACLHALELHPGDIEGLINLGNAHKERGELKEAAEAYCRAIALQPSDPRAYGNLAETYRDQGKVEDAAETYRRALELQPGFTTAYSNLLYLHAFTRGISLEEELAVARGWERVALSAAERETARSASDLTSGVFAARPLAGRRLRVGIVSAELGTHAVAEFLEPFLQTMDRERFHLTLFATVGRTGSRAQRLRSLADEYISLIGVPDNEAVRVIRQQEIDVLMDTSGHTSSNRLGIFARRAAPVQCTYIGYWSTTGLSEMDWFISDPDAPVTVQTGFSEGLWRLPRIAVSYQGDPSLAYDQWEPDRSGKIRLGSFNKLCKMRGETLALWAKVLRALPESQLILEDRGTHEGESHGRIRQGLAVHGIASERVEFIPYLPGHERHMLLYNQIDIALDTIPFNSGTTAFDALWMGVPLVALDGDWIGGRMAASVLRALGRKEWIANRHQEYVEIVRDLARDVELRTHLRRTQRAQMAASELCDATGLACALQESFLSMYERWLTTKATLRTMSFADLNTVGPVEASLT